jgi:hypothetical protein
VLFPCNVLRAILLRCVFGVDGSQDIVSAPNSTMLGNTDLRFWGSATDTDAPVLVHRGSTISEASEECIKQVEEDEKILEEDEDAEED